MFVLKTKKKSLPAGHFVCRGKGGGLCGGLVQELDFVKGWFESRTLKTNRLMCATSAADLSKTLYFRFKSEQGIEPFVCARTMAWSTSLSRGEEGGLPAEGLVQILDFVTG